MYAFTEISCYALQFFDSEPLQSIFVDERKVIRYIMR